MWDSKKNAHHQFLALASLLFCLFNCHGLASGDDRVPDPTLLKDLPAEGFPKVALKHSIMLQKHGVNICPSAAQGVFTVVLASREKAIAYLLDESDLTNNEPYNVPLDEIVLTKDSADPFVPNILNAAQLLQYGSVISIADSVLKVAPSNSIFFCFKSKASDVLQSQNAVLGQEQLIEKKKERLKQTRKNVATIAQEHVMINDYYSWVNRVNESNREANELEHEITTDDAASLKTAQAALDSAKKDFKDYADSVVRASNAKHEMAVRAVAWITNPEGRNQQLTTQPQAGAINTQTIATDTPPDTTKASKIILPKVNFHQATVDEGLSFFRMKSRELDPDKIGVPIILAVSEQTKQTRVDLDLVNVSVADAVKYLAIAANLEMTRNGEAVILKSR